jgi:GGDEF domain-containing protein
MLLNDRLIQAMASAQRHRTALAVLFVDVDRFKRINDTLGHASGDRLLKSIAQRLDGTDAEVLLKNADIALLNAKARGRGNHQFFQPGMNSRAG